jgi:hypothetical protein
VKFPVLRPVVPPHVFALVADGVTYASIRRDPPRGFAHARHFAYPPNTLGAGASGTPLFTREAVSEAVEAGRRLSEGRLSRASVVFPDSWARILPIDFDSLPDSGDAAREMVVWKLKKLLPGVTVELAVVFREIPRVGEQRRLLVAAAPVETLRSVEQSFEAAGVRIGLLAPASLVLLEGLSPLLSARARGDFALVSRSEHSFVFAISRDGTPIFFRQRPVEERGEDQAQEVRLSLSYYEEKLGGGGLSAVYLHDTDGNGGFPEDLFPVPPQSLAGRLLDADPGFDSLIASRPELLPAFAAVSAEK